MDANLSGAYFAAALLCAAIFLLFGLPKIVGALRATAPLRRLKREERLLRSELRLLASIRSKTAKCETIRNNIEVERGLLEAEQMRRVNEIIGERLTEREGI